MNRKGGTTTGNVGKRHIMRPIYESIPNDLEIYYRPSVHFTPHIHDLVEIIYVLYGTLEIGIDEELFHMEKGDIAFVFPGKIRKFDTPNSPRALRALFSTIKV